MGCVVHSALQTNIWLLPTALLAQQPSSISFLLPRRRFIRAIQPFCRALQSGAAERPLQQRRLLQTINTKFRMKNGR